MMKYFISLLATLLFISSSLNAEDYQGPIIDMHIHAYDEGVPLFGMPHPPTMRGQSFVGAAGPEDLRAKVFEKFKKFNIVKAVVTHGDLWKPHAPDTILIAEAKKSPEALQAQFEREELEVLAEMSPFYQGITADDPSQAPYFKIAEDAGIPVGFHIFPGGPNGGLYLMPQMLGKMRVKNADPMQLENVLIKYPKLKLYIMHGGWPYVDDVKALLYMHPNLHVDISVLNWAFPEAELHSYLKALVSAGFGNRIMFGTDQMVWPDTIDIAIASVNNADFLTFKQKEDIFYNNAARFLSLGENEISMHKSN